jgi:hypothetical protein
MNTNEAEMVHNAIIDNNCNNIIKYINNDNIDGCFLFACRRRNFKMMHYILTLYRHTKLNPVKITIKDVSRVYLTLEVFTYLKSYGIIIFKSQYIFI